MEPIELKRPNEQDSQAGYAQATRALEVAITLMDEALPEDIPLDHATSLRVGIDQIAIMTELPLDTKLSQRVGHLLARTIKPPGQPFKLAGSTAANMLEGLELLKAALTQEHSQFTTDYYSPAWADLAKSEAVINAVEQVRQILPWIAESEAPLNDTEIKRFLTKIQRIIKRLFN